MPNESGLTPLGEFAHQNFLVGNPPMLLFTEDNKRVDRELLALSMQLRQAQATERLAQAIEEETRLHGAKSMPGFSADQWEDGFNHLRAAFVKGERLVEISVLGTSTEMAQKIVEGIAMVLQAVQNASEAQEGGQRA